MRLNEQEKIKYLANLVAIARADGQLTPNECQAIEEARKRIDANRTALKKAENAAETPDFVLEPVGALSAKISNLEELVSVSMADGCLDEAEEPAILDFAHKAGVTKEQLQTVLVYVKSILTANKAKRVCPGCGASISSSAKFCPQCGGALGPADKERAVAVSYNIPKKGITIEFAESTASGFPDAVSKANNAPINASCVKGKKTWYMAAWEMAQILDATKVVEDLKGMRNRKVWLDGKEARWDEVFGFTRCCQQRDSAYRPIEYCFGVSEKRLNVWGCQQAGMDWMRWANWFSYGEFKKSGFLKNQITFVFDKKRIRHELETNLFKVRHCPYLDFSLVEAVLDALPEEVQPQVEGPWVYSHDYDESPGAIKVTEKTVEGGYSYVEEYYSSGVEPKSPEIALEILKRAASKLGTNTSNLKGVLKYRE